MQTFTDTAKTTASPAANLQQIKNDAHAKEHEVKLQSSLFFQPKLTVGAADDPLEKEADEMADKVMRMEKPDIQLKPFPITPIQRKCAHCEEEEKKMQRKEESGNEVETTGEFQRYVNGLNNSGAPLPSYTKSFFESRMGYDFSSVKIYNDSVAAKSAQSINALAYTSGNRIVFNQNQYSPGTKNGKRLLGHELTHVVQQGGAAPRCVQTENNRASTAFLRTSGQTSFQASNDIQRAGDPTAIPPGLRCPTDLTSGRPAGTDVLFPVSGSTITPTHTTLLTTFRTSWLTAGGTDNILVHGYASTDGDQGPNWTVSCDRAEAVQAELVRLGIPAVRISVVAHGESTDFGASAASNRHAVVSTSSPGILPSPLVGGILNPVDNFAGHSTTRFGVGEGINLSFFSFPPRPAADFGGLEWRRAAGGGTLVPGITPNDGTATYTAPAIAGAVLLELRVATGATAGRVISTHAITIVIPSGVHITEVPGTAPNFTPGGTIPTGTWGAGFLGNVFVDPRDVSFQGIVFGEGTVAAVVTPVGSFFSSVAGTVHPVNTFGPGHAGNATTGTPVSPPSDQISGSGIAPTGSLLGVPTCGASDFLWAIPWEFSVAGSARTPFAGGFTANHHMTSTFLCDATIEKGGAGPFRRSI